MKLHWVRILNQQHTQWLEHGLGPRGFGHRRLGRLLPPPLPQALHLARLQLVQVLFLHVQAAQSGAESIVGNVLLLLGLRVKQVWFELIVTRTSASLNTFLL